MRLGLGLGWTSGGGGSFLSMTGLTLGEARPGDHASLSVGFPSGVTSWASQAWGVGSYGDTTYGTGANPTDYTASDGATLVWEGLGDDGNTYRASAPIRYAAGSVTESALADWTIDDDALNVNLASDFTTTNLTGSYVITGLPTGAVDDGDGTISGTVTDKTPATFAPVVTFTDQYGRTIVGTYAVDTILRAQATGGVDLDLSFAEDSAIASTDLAQNWTLNGNALTYTVSPALPAGLSMNSSGVMTGTPTTVTADATYTLTGTDEYGRVTTDTFALEITSAFNPLADYAVSGNQPGLILDFADDTYSIDGNSTTDFDTALNYTGDSLSTMVDSDGALKWAPHNLALNSASPATQNITVVSGADYTVELTGTGSITLSGAGTGTVTEGSPVEITASTTTLTLTVAGSVDTMWAYRSDLGGMVDNPDRGDSYVPTTSAAVYMPRRNSHLWDGSQWVNEGLLLETEVRTNLFTYSNDFTDAYWEKTNTATLALDATGPDGVANSAVTLVDSGATGTGNVRIGKNPWVLPGAGTYAFSVYAKAHQLNWLSLQELLFDGGTNYNYFDLANGVLGATQQSGTQNTIEDVGNGWYRCTIVMSSTTDLSGAVFIACANANGGFSVDLDGTSSIRIADAQFEEGSTPSSYIPTAGAAATRAAQSLTVPSTNTTPSTTAISMQIDGGITYADDDAAAQQTFLRWQADANNYISLDLDADSTATGEVNANQAVGGTVDTVVAASEYSPGVNVDFNIASRHTSGAINVSKDGTAATEDTTPTSLVDLDAQDIELGQDFMGHIGQFRLWEDVDLADAGIEAASTPPSAPVLQLTAADLQAQEVDGDVPVALTGDNGTYNWILTTTDPDTSAPSKAQVDAGNDHTGSAAAASGSVTVTSGSPTNIALPSGLDGTYYFVVADGDSVVFDGTGQAIDTTLPAFSSAATDAVDGTEITVTLDESVSGTGTAADWDVVINSGAAVNPDSATVSGTTVTLDMTSNAIANGDTVTVAYTKGANVIADAVSNELASFTAQSVTNNVPAASSGPALLDHDADSAPGTNEQTKTIVLDMSGHNGTDDIFLLLVYTVGPGWAVGGAPPTGTLDGNDIGSFIANEHVNDQEKLESTAYRISGTTFAASSTLSLTVPAGETLRNCYAAAFAAPPATTIHDSSSKRIGTSASITTSVDTLLNGSVIALAGALRDPVSWTGLTEVAEVTGIDFRGWSIATANGVPAETGRSITAECDGGDATGDLAIIALSLS